MERPFTPPEQREPASVTHLSPVPPGPGDPSLLGATVLAAFGAAALAVDALGRAIRDSAGRPDRTAEPGAPPGAATALGAAAALTLATGRSVARTTAAVGRGAAFAGNVVIEAGPPSLRRFREELGRRTAELDASWRSERIGAEAGARRIGDALVPEVVAAVLDTMDLTQIVADRVDLDRVVGEVDLAAIVDRVDIGGVVDRLDIQAIVDRVDVQAVIDRLDLNAIVQRVDIDEIVAHVDLDAVVARIDVVGLAGEVIEQLDIASLIRESTEAVTKESVQGMRVQSARADRFVQHAVDSVLRRRGGGRGGTPHDGGAGAPGSETETS